jgi:hypothetical protein
MFRRQRVSAHARPAGRHSCGRQIGRRFRRPNNCTPSCSPRSGAIWSCRGRCRTCSVTYERAVACARAPAGPSRSVSQSRTRARARIVEAQGRSCVPIATRPDGRAAPSAAARARYPESASSGNVRNVVARVIASVEPARRGGSNVQIAMVAARAPRRPSRSIVVRGGSASSPRAMRERGMLPRSRLQISTEWRSSANHWQTSSSSPTLVGSSPMRVGDFHHAWPSSSARTSGSSAFAFSSCALVCSRFPCRRDGAAASS